MATDWAAREAELQKQHRATLNGHMVVAAKLKREQEAEAKQLNATAAADSGVAGRYSDDFKKRYAELLAKGKTSEAQQMLTGEMAGEFMGERDEGAYTPERIQAETTQANTYDAVDPGQAREYEAALAGEPDDVTVGPLKDVERVTADNPGAAHTADFDRVAGETLDTSKADQVRQQQERYLATLEKRASGEGPSVAEGQYNQKQQEIAKNVLGQAATARGSDKGYARLVAMRELADQGRKAAFDTATLRADEMTKAGEALGGNLGSVRGQDVDVAKTAAQLRQEAALSNQRTGSTVNLANADALNKREDTSADRALQAASTNAGATNTRTMSEAELRTGVATGNAARDQQGDQFDADARNKAAAVNAAAVNSRGDSRAALLTGVAGDNAKTLNSTGQFNATQRQDAAGKNQAAGLQGNAQETDRKQGLAGSALTATGQTGSIEQTRMGVPKAPSTGDRILGAVTTLGAAALSKSDERAKKNVKDVPEAAAERLARALDVKEFEYKDPADGEGKRMGVMAQDLERAGPLGKKLVHEDDSGTKSVDYAGLTSLLLAAALRGKKEARR